MGNMNDPWAESLLTQQHGNHRIYHLYVTDTVGYTGQDATPLPSTEASWPKLEFTEGDTAEIHVHNPWNGNSYPLAWALY